MCSITSLFMICFPFLFMCTFIQVVWSVYLVVRDCSCLAWRREERRVVNAASVHMYMYSLVQWTWFQVSDITWCNWISCIQWRQRTNFTAPGCTAWDSEIDRLTWLIKLASNGSNGICAAFFAHLHAIHVQSNLHQMMSVSQFHSPKLFTYMYVPGRNTQAQHNGPGKLHHGQNCFPSAKYPLCEPSL